MLAKWRHVNFIKMDTSETKISVSSFLFFLKLKIYYLNV